MISLEKNKNLPKVSIMIPTYNQELFIADAIQSALAQDYGNLEIIISDDCSSDNTGKIAQQFLKDSRVKYYKNTQNLGRVGNYHKMLYDYVSGDWIVNLDGDDYYTDNQFISKAINAIQQIDSNSVVAYLAQHNVTKIKKKIDCKKIDNHTILLRGLTYFYHYFKIRNFSHLGTLYKREAAMQINAYTKNYLAADFETLMRLFITGDVILSDYIIGKWRVHANNETTRLSADNKYEDTLKAFDDITDFANSYGDPQKNNIWYKKAKKAAYSAYIQNYIIYSPPKKNRIKMLKLLAKNFRFSREYLRLWYYYLSKKL